MKDNEYVNVEDLREFLIENILRNNDIMFSDDVRGLDDNNIDLVGVIVGMYEIIHRMKYGKKYDYMFHWANKLGAWVETDYLKEIIERRKHEQ